MPRPPNPTFINAEHEELRRHATGGVLEVTWKGETRKVKTAENDHLARLLRAERVVLAHHHWQQAPRVQAASVPDTQWVTLVPDDDIRQLAFAWQQINSVIWEIHPPTTPSEAPRKRLALRLSAFYQAYEPLMASYQPQLLHQEAIPNDHVQAINLHLQQGLEQYQRSLQDRGTARAIEQGKINAKRNLRSLTRYVEDLVSAHSSLYVVHLDLGYHVFERATIAKATYTRLREDLRKLFYARHCNPLWKDDLVGHIWKIEDSPQRRFHAHLLLFYRGSTAEQHREDVTHLQNRWIREITKQEGACFARMNPEGEAPVWVPENTGYLIKREDTEALSELTRYLHYLIKVDQLYGLEAEKKSYIFAKGNTPRRHAGETP